MIDLLVALGELKRWPLSDVSVAAGYVSLYAQLCLSVLLTLIMWSSVLFSLVARYLSAEFDVYVSLDNDCANPCRTV